MIAIFSRFLIVFAICTGSVLYATAQTGADNQSSVIPRAADEDRPRNIKESLEKMRIEKEKKDFERMLERGEEAVKITEEIEATFERKGRLTEKEKTKLAAVEKLARQIRNDLGGGDDKTEQIRPHGESVSFLDAIRSLRSSTQDLFGELKKSSRFTVSAAAIQSSNAVLRLARFLRIGQ
jgi:hypothetical protein